MMELIERKAEYGLAYIMYMRFARRTEGVKPYRGVFGRDWWAPWEVYDVSGPYLLFFLSVQHSLTLSFLLPLG